MMSKIFFPFRNSFKEKHSLWLKHFFNNLIGATKKIPGKK